MKLFNNIKPKFYKRAFYIGKYEIIKFTLAGLKKFLYKLIWGIIIFVMLVTMILGGLSLTQPQQNSQIIYY